MKLGLETISAVLERLDNPQKRFKTIHIAGTNGKGSIAAMLAAILQVSGFKVGLFTSPHLIKFNERIQIDGAPISDAAVVDAFNKVRSANRNTVETFTGIRPTDANPVEPYKKVRSADKGIRELTFFEMAAAMAFHVFSKQQVDWAVIETGMGGRMDATNVLLPKVSIISNISLEHKEYLGDTLAKITFEKAGIIKPTVPVVTAVKQSPARKSIQDKAFTQKAPLYRLGHDFKVRRAGANRFHYYGLDHTFHQLKVSLSGYHQVDNAALAISSCEVLQRQGHAIPEEAIREGLLAVTWPGRLEVVSKEPYLVLDGAHNLAAVKELARYLKSASDTKWTLVIGIFDDKPFKEIIATLMPYCHNVIATRPANSRALTAEILATEAAQYHAKVTTAPTVAAAIEKAVQNWHPGQGICVAGSLYVIGEAKSYLEKQDVPDPGELLTSA